MRAAVVERFGPPEVFAVRELPDPVLGAGEVLLEVALISVTFVETQVRGGRPPNPAMRPSPPFVPGNGVGGVVVAAADDVDPHLVGARVVATTGGRNGYAELVAVPAGALIRVPDALPLSTAVALLADGRTALALIERARVASGDDVLVEAAAGGVGACLTQLARRAGARVAAAARGAAKLDAVAPLGADLLVDYSLPGWEATVRSAFGGLDVAFDGVGGAIGDAALQLVRPGGRFCSFGVASGRSLSLRADAVEFLPGVALTPQRMRELSIEALVLAERGALAPLIGQIRPLEEVAQAHAAVEARRVIGKTLLSTGAAADSVAAAAATGEER